MTLEKKVFLKKNFNQSYRELEPAKKIFLPQTIELKVFAFEFCNPNGSRGDET